MRALRGLYFSLNEDMMMRSFLIGMILGFAFTYFP